MPLEYTYEHHLTGTALEGPKVRADYVYGFAYNKLLYSGRTEFQTIELYETPLFGKLLKLDGFFQTSEKDEFFYHEMQTQTALCAHSKPEKVLIIGGGDGGILKNVLKHKTVKKAVLVEIDKGVVEFSMKYLKTICGNSFTDKRTHLIIGDGKRFVEETNEKFDVIISDLTDPVGPSKALYTKEFYQSINKILMKDGIFQLHIEMCVTRPRLSRDIYNRLAAVFKYAVPSSQYVPLYGGLMAFATVSQTINAAKIKPAVIDQRLRGRNIKDLKLYNGKFHEAVYTLPNFLRALYSK